MSAPDQPMSAVEIAIRRRMLARLYDEIARFRVEASIKTAQGLEVIAGDHARTAGSLLREAEALAASLPAEEGGPR